MSQSPPSSPTNPQLSAEAITASEQLLADQAITQPESLNVHGGGVERNIRELDREQALRDKILDLQVRVSQLEAEVAELKRQKAEDVDPKGKALVEDKMAVADDKTTQ